MIIVDLVEALDHVLDTNIADSLPVMVSAGNGVFEVTGVRFDEDRVLLEIAADRGDTRPTRDVGTGDRL